MKNVNKLISIDGKLVLASASPRRQKLLSILGLEFEVYPAEIDENNYISDSPEEIVLELARKKVEAVRAEFKEAVIIGSDTLVWLDGNLLSKPDSSADAFRMLTALSGKTHKVFTGICILDTYTGKVLQDYAKTEVTFREITDDEKWAYIAGGSPLDKAGAYGIQDDFGSVFVTHINGCYYNIVGLPVSKLYSMLKEMSL